MTVAELAELSGIGMATIKRLEAVDGLPPAHARTIEALRHALENSGVDFLGGVDNSPGVCLTRRPVKRISDEA